MGPLLIEEPRIIGAAGVRHGIPARRPRQLA
jgi:hypothetical protein